MSMLKGLTSIGQLGHTPARNARRGFFHITITTATQKRPFRLIPCPQASEEPPKIHGRDELNPQRSEGTNTGTDNEVASHHSAYDPSTTTPESEIAEAEEETKRGGKVSNPLDVSAANRSVSKARDPLEGGPDHNAEKAGPSTRGWTRKGKEVHFGEKR